ncbi:hypothetical protein Pcinc_021609 [Petrolisthes cinctipes]|uniref:Alpha and gamma adaptin binding protein n=1 Tax=Petrolisthes cinctipes TaxID=88211 RepID=A0AAE1FGN9_PETCI|nr:hypothetical protein Pcinc_021609 [Petrolisthes cinctipes]
MDSKPSLVILSTGGTNCQHIVKGILETEYVSEPTAVNSGVNCWPWELENKYYTASVQLAAVVCPEQSLPWILGNGEALLVYCDATQSDVLDSLNGLVEKMGEFEPEVQLLVCDACSSDNNGERLSRLTAQQWCISNGWELVELEPHSNEPEYSDEEDDFPESFGFKRIRQALHAHTWSNLTMKDSQGSRLGAVLQSVASEERSSVAEATQESEEVTYSRLADLSLNENPQTESGDSSNLDLEGALDSSTLQGDVGSFEDLFSNFEHLKRTAAGLPPEQRRDYAEKVAVAFWRAMGGDEDEVTGLDSDGDI